MMVPVLGNSLAFPPFPWDGPIGTLNNQTLTAADTTQKIAYIGQFHNKDYATKNITSVKFRPANVTFNVASVLTVSLQDVGATGGPIVPDEVIDQSFTIVGTNLASNTWTSGNLNSSRTVQWGERIAVVFQISTFNASDSVQIQGQKISATLEFHMPCISKKNTTWSADTTSSPNVVFGCDDGTLGTFLGSRPILQRNQNQYNSGSSPNEYALHIVAPYPMIVHGCWMEYLHDNSSSTSTVSLYDSANNVLASKTLDQTWFQNTSTGRFIFVGFGTTVNIAAGTLYRLGWKATSANNITLANTTAQNATDLDTWDAGSNVYMDSRTGSGSWSPTTTRRPRMGLLISHLDDGFHQVLMGRRPPITQLRRREMRR